MYQPVAPFTAESHGSCYVYQGNRYYIRLAAICYACSTELGRERHRGPLANVLVATTCPYEALESCLDRIRLLGFDTCHSAFKDRVGNDDDGVPDTFI